MATVSRFLDGGLKLPPETAQCIERAVRALDYRANSQARHLSLGRSETIGLVVPEIDNPFFARMADAVELAAEQHGLGLLLCVSRNQPQRELDYLALLRSNQVDGLLFLTNHLGTKALTRSINALRHVVVLDEDVPDARVPKVFIDNEAGGFLAGAALLGAGHRRLAFVGGPAGMLSTTERLAGFRRALAGTDAELVQAIYDDYTPPGGARAAEALLAADRPATGVFLTSDAATCGFLAVLAARGLTVPHDVSVISFDDVEPLSLFAPPVTAIRQPVAEVGRHAVELLLAQIAGTAPRRAPVLRLPVALVNRGSVAAPRRSRSLADGHTTGGLNHDHDWPTHSAHGRRQRAGL